MSVEDIKSPSDPESRRAGWVILYCHLHHYRPGQNPLISLYLCSIVLQSRVLILVKMHQITAHNVICQKCFTKPTGVEIQNVAYGIINIHLSKVVILIEEQCQSESKKVTNRSPNYISQTNIGIKHPCLVQQQATTPVASKFQRLFFFAALTAWWFRQDGL